MAEEVKQLKHLKLAVFFTYGVSLKRWQELGMLGREMALYERLAKELGGIYFLTYDREDESLISSLCSQGITVLPKKYPLPNWLYSIFLPFIYRRELKQAHLYKTNQMLGSWSAVIASRLFHVPLIVRTGYSLSSFAKARGTWRFFIARIIEKIASANAQVITVATPSDANEWSKRGVQAIVVPNFVDTEKFQPQRGKKSSEGESLRLLAIGRLTPQKNYSVLLSALSRFPQVELDIIGSGPLHTSLVTQAKTLGVSVHFHGNVPHDELPVWLERSDIFVLPSLYEGHPKVLLEAMAMEKAILATDVPGIREVLTHGKNAYIVPPAAAGLAEGLLALKKNPDLRQSLGIEARKTVVAEYSLEKILERELNLYATLI